MAYAAAIPYALRAAQAAFQLLTKSRPAVQAVTATGAGVAAGYTMKEVIKEVTRKTSKSRERAKKNREKCRECCKNKPCIPPIGSIGFRLDLVPPSAPHDPCPADHIHLKVRFQDTRNCHCSWRKPKGPKKNQVVCVDRKTFVPPKKGWTQLKSVR